MPVLPPCCAEPLPSGPARPRHDPLPAVTQYASPDLIGAIAYNGHDGRGISLHITPVRCRPWGTTGAEPAVS